MARQPALLFLAPGDAAKGRVEPISWMRTCDAFARRGLDVTLATLAVERPDAVARADIWAHYGIEPSFRLLVLPTRLRRDAGVWRFRVSALLPTVAYAAVRLARQAVRPRPLVVYARSPVLAAPYALLRRLLPRSRRPLLVLETHAFPGRDAGRVLRAVDLVVVTSDTLARDVASDLGVQRERILRSQLCAYASIHPLPRDEARRRLGLPLDADIGCYAGKLTEEHVDFLLHTAAAAVRRSPRFRLLLVGGNPEILEWTRRRVDELALGDIVLLAGFVAPAEVEQYLAAADVLLYYMPSSISIFPYCTPAKGFDYQAAGRPVVATDLPLFEEVFGPDGERAVRVREHEPEALAAAAVAVLAQPDRGAAMGERAAAWAAARTWDERAGEALAALGIAQ